MSVRPHEIIDDIGDDVIELSEDPNPEQTAKRARIKEMLDEHGELQPEYVEYFNKFFADNEEIYNPEDIGIGKRPGWAVTSQHWVTFLTRSVIYPMQRADPRNPISRSVVMHWGFANYDDIPPANKVDRYLIIVTMYPRWKISKTEKRSDGEKYLEPDKEVYGPHDILIIINTKTKKIHALDSSGFLNQWTKYMILDLLFPVHQALSNPLDTITRPADHIILTGESYHGPHPYYSAQAHAISIENMGRIFASRFKNIYKYEMIIEPVRYNLGIRIESATNNPKERGWCAWFTMWFTWWCLVNPDKKPIPPPIPRNAISDFSTFVFSAMGHVDKMPPIPATIVKYLRAAAVISDEIILPATHDTIGQELPPIFKGTPAEKKFRKYSRKARDEESTTVHLLEEPDETEETVHLLEESDE